MARVAAVCAVCLILAASVTLQGCGDDAESTASSLRGNDNSTAVSNTATPGSNKTSAEDVSRESKTAATEKTVKKTNDKLTSRQQACVRLQQCGYCSSEDGWGQCVPSKKEGAQLYCATTPKRIDSVCPCSAEGVKTCDSCRSGGVWGKCVLNTDDEAVCSTTDHAQQWADNSCTLFDVAGFKFKTSYAGIPEVSCSWITEDSDKMAVRRKNRCKGEVAKQCASACDLFNGDACKSLATCSSCSSDGVWGKCVHTDKGARCSTDHAQQWAANGCTLFDEEDFRFKHKITQKNQGCPWIAANLGLTSPVTAQRRTDYCSGEVVTQCASACDFFAREGCRPALCPRDGVVCDSRAPPQKCDVCSTRAEWGKCVPLLAGDHANHEGNSLACATDAQNFLFPVSTTKMQSCEWITKNNIKLDIRRSTHCTIKSEVATKCAMACTTCDP